MPETPKFPVRLHHPKTGGETTAATRSSLRVLEARGWKRGPAPAPEAPAKKATKKATKTTPAASTDS